MFQCTTAELEYIWQLEQISEHGLNEIMKESLSFSSHFIDKFPFKDYYFDIQSMKELEGDYSFTERGNVITEIINFPNERYIEVQKKYGEVIKQIFFDSRNGVSKFFEREDNVIRKFFKNFKLEIFFNENHLETLYYIRYKETSISESYTLRNNGDIIKTIMRYREDRIETAVLYTNGDWYYTSGDINKTIIMGKNNYQNKIRQEFPYNEIINDNKIIKGIKVGNTIFGNDVHLDNIRTNFHRRIINNGIVKLGNYILINGYPKCVTEPTRPLFHEFDRFVNTTEFSHEGYVICIRYDGTKYRTSHWKIIEKILSSVDTQWDVCCDLTYESKMKNIYWTKKNNISENGVRGNVMNIIDLGAAYSYVDGVNKIMWNKIKASSGASSNSSSSSTSASNSDFSTL